MASVVPKRCLKINISDVSTAPSERDVRPSAEPLVITLFDELARKESAGDSINHDNYEIFKELYSSIETKEFQRALVKCLRGKEDGITKSCSHCKGAREALGVYVDEKCICYRLYCNECHYGAGRCDCKRPTVVAKAESEDEEGTDIVCEIGGETRFCSVCGKCSDFENMEPCDARGCTLESPQLCHVACVTRVVHEAYSEGALLCPLCVATGRLPFHDTDTDSEYSVGSDDTHFSVNEWGDLQVGSRTNGGIVDQIWPNMGRYTTRHTQGEIEVVRHHDIF